MELRSVAVLFLWEGGEREKYAREACAACRRGFVGGWLLRRWKSAKTVFQKSELASLKQRTFEKQRRFPPPKKRSPPAESGDRQHTPHGLAFQGGRVVWLLGSWMSYQCYAVLKYKQC